ncbi:hypothetical protein KCP78_00840 [Salmonella enterica subsp. enterica]|nr:hypothetical protein KCP78_00840 [Salmonella enterica subsp. enterica]
MAKSRSRGRRTDGGHYSVSFTSANDASGAGECESVLNRSDAGDKVVRTMGKAQYCQAIQRHFGVTQGEIRFHDMPLTHLQLDGWRSRLAVVTRRRFVLGLYCQYCARTPGGDPRGD